jgi:Lon protease-like protein
MTDPPARPDRQPESEPSPAQSYDLSSIPLFPLPTVVLFPRAVLPLHIFEERYKEMTATALAGDKQVAMALLKPGWEKDYYHRPAIEPVVCVGTILSHERLPDGKYNFLLQGHTRARVIREVGNRSYRLAELEPLRQTSDLEIDLGEDRQRLDRVFRPALLGGTPVGRQFRQLLAGPMRTSDIADLIAFNYLDDVPLKQSLLEETDVRRRVRRILEALEISQPSLQLAYLRDTADPELN